MKKKVLFVSAVVILFSLPCFAGSIRYNVENNTVVIRGYPKDSPCTLKDILDKDKENGWGKIEYKGNEDTYYLKANLHIGGEIGSSTYMQIGTKACPKETFIIHGSIGVSGGLGTEGVFSLGDKLDPSITPTLKIESLKKKSIYIGKGGRGYKAGTFQMYHASLVYLGKTSPPSLRGNFIFENSDISGTPKVSMTYDARNYPHTKHIFKNVRFHDGGIAFCNAWGLSVYDCIFEQLNCAVSDGGGLKDMVFYRCIFKENLMNINLGYGGNVTCIDCKIGKAISKNVLKDYKNGKEKKACLTVKRYMVIEVIDNKGNPIPDALVDVVCEIEDGPAVENGSTATNEDGLTPDRSSSPITVTDYIQTTPVTTYYTYQVKVSRTGCKEKIIKGIDPDNTWFDKEVTLKVVMEK